MAKKDLFTRDIPTGVESPSQPADDVLESPRMSLAPVPAPASVPGAVPPQNLEAEESVLAAIDDPVFVRQPTGELGVLFSKVLVG